VNTITEVRILQKQEILDQLDNYKLLKEGSAPKSQSVSQLLGARRKDSFWVAYYKFI
jgi:hypothetical protein